MKEIQYYPMTQPQKLILLALKYSIRKSVANICSIIDLIDPIDENRMLQAIYLTMLRIPSNRVRIRRVNKQPMQYFATDVPSGIDLEDLSELSDEQRKAKYEKWSTTPFPHGGMDTQLYRVKLVRRSGGLHSLYFCVSHVIFDAYSLMACLKYIEQIYCALGDDSPLPKEFPSPIPAYEADYEYHKGKRYQQDLAWWREQFDPKDEPKYTTIDGPDSKECIPNKNYGVTLRLWQTKGNQINLRIPKQLVDGVQAAATAQRVSAQCVYLLAVRSFLADICKSDDVTMMNTVARPATIVQKRAGGTMVNSVPFRTRISGETSFQDACMEMNRVQREIYRHGNVSSEELFEIIREQYHTPAMRSYYCVHTTFQPYFETAQNGLRFSGSRLSNGVATMPLYISIMPCDMSGDLWANYEYIVGFIKPENIHRLHAFMLAFLEQGLQQPTRSLKELSAASQQA